MLDFFLLLLNLLYNICSVPGFEPEILRPPTGVLSMSHTYVNAQLLGLLEVNAPQIRTFQKERPKNCYL